MKNIEILRNKVNKINEDIVNLLIERKTITDELIQEKIDNHLPVLDTKRENEIISLRFFEGKTQMEVAEMIGISQAQVSRLEKNALKFMKKYVQ